MELFVYDWTTHEGGLQAYAITPGGETRVVNVLEFHPWVYLEVKSARQPLPHAVQRGLLEVLKKERNVFSVAWEFRTPLYGAASDAEPRQMLRVRAQTQKGMHFLVRSLKENGLRLTCGHFAVRVYDAQASPVLQFTTERQIAPTGWVRVAGREDPQNPQAVNAFAHSVGRLANPPAGLAVPRVLSFDIEVYSSNPARMPDAAVVADRVFQISMACSTGEKLLLTLGTPDPIEDVTVRSYATETDLLIGYAAEVRRLDPHFITGYNIFKFDLPYLIARAKLNHVSVEFGEQGVNGMRAQERTIKWSSAAFSNQEFQFLAVPGRVTIDMLTVVQRDFKMDNYRLKTVTTHFLGATKDPMTPRGIFASYGLLLHATENPGDAGAARAAGYALAKCGKYCVQDADLVLRLFEHLQTFVGCAEMSGVMHVPMSVLFTQGQQIRMFSQVFKQCYAERRVVNRERDEPSEKIGKYMGAYVFEPVPGVYDHVVSFDFNSLYPTTQIAYNICPSTYVPEGDPRPDAECHVIDINSHAGCEHDPSGKQLRKEDVMCSDLRARFVKAPTGVLPRLLQDLLAARAATRKQLKQLRKEDPLGEVLDKRQLALKVSANSVYGSMGASVGYMPFLIGAAATTAAGRRNIARAAEYMKDNGVHLVYGDTDSVYVRFTDRERTCTELWDHCLEVEKAISKLFPAPMYMGFEEAIYQRYLILSKKRYVCTKADRSGAISKSLTVRGIVLTRRDNARITRALYETVVMMIFNRAGAEAVRAEILEYIIRLCTRQFELPDFVITKSVKETTDYAVRPLSDDPAKRQARLREVCARSIRAICT